MLAATLPAIALLAAVVVMEDDAVSTVACVFTTAATVLIAPILERQFRRKLDELPMIEAGEQDDPSCQCFSDTSGREPDTLSWFGAAMFLLGLMDMASDVQLCFALRSSV